MLTRSYFGASVRRDKMRVLQVIGSLHYGGAEKVVTHLATGIDSSRFEMRVACTRDVGILGEEMAASGVPVLSPGPAVGVSRYLIALRMAQLIRDFRPDVVHTHGLVALGAIGPLAYLGMLPHWIHTFHYGNYPYNNSRHMRMERLFARRASQLVAVAATQRDAVVRLHGIRPDRISVVHNGVKPNMSLADESIRSRKRAELGLNASDFVVGSIAVLSEQKGIRYLLLAARLVLAQHPHVTFLIVGGGPLESQLRAEAEALGLTPHIRFTGWRSDVPELLVSIDVYVMASLWEAMPLALLEAMAARRAIVVTNVGDNSAFVGRGDCALVVPPCDPAGLAAAIETLVADQRRADDLATRALERFNQEYTVERMVASYEALYRRARPVLSG